MHLNRNEHGHASALRRCSVLALTLAALACAEKPTLAILPVKTADATAEEAGLFRSELEKTFRNNPDVRYVEVSSSALEEIGAANGCSDAECAIQAGRVLDADQVVTPIVSKDGENWMMTLRLVDARSGEVTVSKAGLSGSSASAAATDFSAALTEPMVAALHVAAPAVAVAPAFAAPTPAPVYSAPTPEADAPAAEPTYAASTPAPEPQKAPEPTYTPAPAIDATASTEAPSEEDRPSASDRKTKIAIWTGAGLLVAGGIAAAVVLMGGESSTSAPVAPPPGGGTNNDNTMSVTVKWN